MLPVCFQNGEARPVAKISKRTIEALTPRENDFFIWDDDVKNFGVRVMPSGRKTFLVQYRANGRTRRVKVGVFGSITADEARQQAKRLLGEVAHGEDPAEGIAIDRKSPTVATVCERFLQEHVSIRCKPSTEIGYRGMLERQIKPAFGTRRITDISRPDIAKLHFEMRDRPHLANRTLSVLSKMFNLCELWGIRPDGSNPCRHVPKYRETARERFLSPEEIASVGAVLDQAEAEGSETKPACDAIRLLILTGCRLGEIQTLKWEYVQPPYLVLPDSKTGARRIPISEDVQAVLSRIERIDGNPFVLVGKNEGQHLAEIRHPWKRLQKRAGLGAVRLHDLRHTYASNALANGVPLEVVGKLLGHTQYQTTLRYAHLADGPLRDAAAHVAHGIGSALTRRQPQNQTENPSSAPKGSEKPAATTSETPPGESLRAPLREQDIETSPQGKPLEDLSKTPIAGNVVRFPSRERKETLPSTKPIATV